MYLQISVKVTDQTEGKQNNTSVQGNRGRCYPKHPFHCWKSGYQAKWSFSLIQCSNYILTLTEIEQCLFQPVKVNFK